MIKRILNKKMTLNTLIFIHNILTTGQSTGNEDDSVRSFMQKRLNNYRLAMLVCAGLILVGSNAFSLDKNKEMKDRFPISIQYFEIPEGKVFDERTVEGIIKSGVTNMWIRDCKSDQSNKIVSYFQTAGLRIDFMTHGNELFHRDELPKISVYDSNYESEVKKKVEQGLAQMLSVDKIDYVYPYIDEPFRQRAFLDFSEPTRKEFRHRYGYDMPLSFELAAQDPKTQLDFLNFQSDVFKDGWLKTQKIVKAFDPRVKIAMTHDSHNVYGGGVNSNSQLAIDDVFHWGGDYADLFVYDIYPYLTFDYRYGETGVYRKPRISQMHYTMAQLRNMTTAFGKTMGFWVGTYNEAWFTRFRGKERAGQFWSEREISYTAIANGSDYIISPSNYMGYNLPVDQNHWDEYAKGMEIIQKAGNDIVKAPKVKANACFIFPRTQYLLLQQEYFNVGLSFELVLRAFGELDIIHEDQITDETLNGYKALVLCDVKLLPERVAKNIEKFVKRGGIVIADCVPQLNEQRKKLSVMASLFGVTSADTSQIIREGQWVPFVNLASKFSFPPASGQTDSPSVFDAVNSSVFGQKIDLKVVSLRNSMVSDGIVRMKAQTGKPVLISRKVGAGSAYLLGFCLQDTYFHACKTEDTGSLNSLYMLIHDVFMDAKVVSHVFSTNPDMEAGFRSNSKEGFVFVINHESINPKTEITLAELPGDVKKIMDIESDKSVNIKVESGRVNFAVDVPWGKTRLLKVIY